MAEKRDVKILAVVGMSGSGKSVVVDYLTEKGVPKVYFGGMILKGMKEAGMADTPENEKKFREEIREKEGKDWVVRQVVEEVRRLILAGQKRIVLDGLYSWTEYKILREEFPGELSVMAVVVPRKIRYKRVGEREVRPLNRQEILARDIAEIENLEKGAPIAMADYFVLNDTDVDNLEKQVGNVLEEIEF